MENNNNKCRRVTCVIIFVYLFQSLVLRRKGDETIAATALQLDWIVVIVDSKVHLLLSEAFCIESWRMMLKQYNSQFIVFLQLSMS